MESISTFFKIEDDPFYQRGEAQGALNIAIEIAGRMKEVDMPIAQIAKYTKLSVEEIEKL